MLSEISLRNSKKNLLDSKEVSEGVLKLISRVISRKKGENFKGYYDFSIEL